MAMRVTEDGAVAVFCRCHSVDEELMIQHLASVQPHQKPTTQKKTRNTQGAEAFDLAVSAGESGGWRFERPGHRRQSHKIRNKICQSMERIGDQSLRVEIISADAFADSHAEIDVETYACNADAGILTIAAGQVSVAMLVRVRMASVMSRLYG